MTLLEQLVESVSTISVKSGDVIVFKFHEAVDCEYLESLGDKLKHIFPHNEVIGIRDDIELDVQNSEDTIEYLENMIKKLKGE